MAFDTPRLRLRALHADDLLLFHAYRSDPEVARYQGWSPMSLADAEAFLRTQTGCSDLQPDAWRQLAIAKRDTDLLIGDVGVWLCADQVQAEFGISLASAAQGQGFASEALRGLIVHLFAIPSIEAIIASTDQRNAPCLALLAQVGMQPTEVRSATYKGERCIEQCFILGRRKD